MNIDWKQVSQCPGYISMKKAVSDNAQKCNRQKWCNKPDERYQQCFDWAIGRAQHYAYHLGKSIEEILNDWEIKRDYSFISYYSNHKFPKYNKKRLIQPGLKSVQKQNKKMWHRSKRMKQYHVLRAINFYQEQNSIRDPERKARWGNEHKKRVAYIRNIKQSL